MSFRKGLTREREISLKTSFSSLGLYPLVSLDYANKHRHRYVMMRRRRPTGLGRVFKKEKRKQTKRATRLPNHQHHCFAQSISSRLRLESPRGHSLRLLMLLINGFSRIIADMICGRGSRETTRRDGELMIM
jgi:hypothetical protein